MKAILAAFARQRARKRLQRIVDAERESYETRRYRERRAAALKGLGRLA